MVFSCRQHVPVHCPFLLSNDWAQRYGEAVDWKAPSEQNAKTGDCERNIAETGMAQEPSAVEQAIARALRDNLERLQRTSEELHHAVNDIVSACASNRPTNALPPLLRAQTSAASLLAALEVLSIFVTLSLHTAPRSPLEAQITDFVGIARQEPPPIPQRPAPSFPTPMTSRVPPPPVVEN